METFTRQGFRVQEVTATVELISYKQNGCRRLAERSREVYDQLGTLILPKGPSDSGGALSYEMVLLVQDYVGVLDRVAKYLHKMQNISFMKRIVAAVMLDTELELLQEELATISKKIPHTYSSIDEEARRRAEDAQDRAADQQQTEGLFQTLLRDQSGAIRALDLNTAQYTEAVEALQKTMPTVKEGTAQKQFLEVATAQLQRASGGVLPDISDVTVTSWEVDIGEPIASGAFGEVCVGVWLNHTKVAVKRLLTPCETDKVRKAFMKEVKVWRQLHHPFVLPLLGACVSAPRPFMICPFMPNGTLIRYVEQYPQEGTRLLYEASQGMNYLHTHQVIHGDFKGVNVLINESGHAQISDFGFATVRAYVTQRSSSNANDDGTGTLRWMSPELLDGAQMSTASDVYAFAITWWEVLTQGELPYINVTSNMILMELIKKGKRPPRPSPDTYNAPTDEVWAFIERCWAQDSAHRPSFAVIAGFLQKEVVREEEGRRKEGATDVYLSYGWNNSRVAFGEGCGAGVRSDPRVLNEAFRRGGVTTWVDVERLNAGSGFEASVAGIVQAKCFVACVTDEYAANPHCSAELSVAVENGIPVVPIVIGEGTAWRETIGALLGPAARYVDAIDGSSESIQLAVEEVRAIATGSPRPNLPAFKPKIVTSPEALTHDIVRKLTLSEGAQQLQSSTPTTPTVVLTNSDPIHRDPPHGSRNSDPVTSDRAESGISVNARSAVMNAADQTAARKSERVVGRMSRLGSGSSTAPLSPPPTPEVQPSSPRPSLFKRHAPPPHPPPPSANPPSYDDAVPAHDSLYASPPTTSHLGPTNPALHRKSNRSSTGTSINYSDRNVTNLDITAITDRIKTDRTVRSLYLQRTNLPPHGMIEILVALDSNPGVREINLSGNTAALSTPQVADVFGKWLATYPSVQELDLSSCRLPADMYLALSQSLLQNASLRRLCLNYNPMDVGNVTTLCDGLKGNESVMEVEMRGCGITLAGGVKVAECLGVSEYVERCDLGENLLGEGDMRAVEGILRSCGGSCEVGFEGCRAPESGGSGTPGTPGTPGSGGSSPYSSGGLTP
ncbi:hypothetical protein HDV00_008510, partial [Rhizophlyctis rosea]